VGEETHFKEPRAIVGSPGLRSIGKMAVEYMIKQLQPRLFAELYSHFFPVSYALSASYITSPSYLGEVGVSVERVSKIPRIEFYAQERLNLVIIKGYQADFNGQYEVADKTALFLKELGVREIVSLAGDGHGGDGVHCAATSSETLNRLKKKGFDAGYIGPFLGFSGLAIGSGIRQGIEGICLFGRTTPNQEEPEFPDLKAAKNVLDTLKIILEMDLDTSTLEKTKPEDLMKGSFFGASKV
jgi:uncharacterized protein